MKLTIAEAELLRGKEQRTAAALKAIKNDIANATARANAANAHPTTQYTQPTLSPRWYSQFEAGGYIGGCYVSDPEEVQRRREMHDDQVLPTPSDQKGYVYTRLDAFGRPGKLTLVSVRTYLCRYYLWQHEQRILPWSSVLIRDRAAIRRIIGKRRLRGAWRCFFFGAGKETAYAFDFSDRFPVIDGKRTRRPVDDGE